jgi:hypothetical protein
MHTLAHSALVVACASALGSLLLLIASSIIEDLIGFNMEDTKAQTIYNFLMTACLFPLGISSLLLALYATFLPIWMWFAPL